MTDIEKQSKIMEAVRLIKRATHKIQCCINEGSVNGAEAKFYDLTELTAMLRMSYAAQQTEDEANETHTAAMGFVVARMG